MRLDWAKQLDENMIITQGILLRVSLVFLTIAVGILVRLVSILLRVILDWLYGSCLWFGWSACRVIWFFSANIYVACVVSLAAFPKFQPIEYFYFGFRFDIDNIRNLVVSLWHYTEYHCYGGLQ